MAIKVPPDKHALQDIESRGELPLRPPETLTDLQLQSKVGHFIHLATRLTDKSERQAASDAGLPYEQELIARDIPPTDFSKREVRAEANSRLWGRNITMGAEERAAPRVLRPSRRS